MKAQARQTVRVDELLAYLRDKYKKAPGFGDCPGAQCSKLLHVFFEAYGVPTSQKKLHEMIAGKEGTGSGGVGNVDLNRRCLICAYRGYRQFYYQKYGMYPGSDVADDFGPASVPEMDIMMDAPKRPTVQPSSMEEMFREFFKKAEEDARRQGKVLTEAEAIRALNEIYIQAGSTFPASLFLYNLLRRKETLTERFVKVLTTKGLTVIHTIFVVEDTDMNDLIQHFFQKNYQNTFEYQDLLLSHVMSAQAVRDDGLIIWTSFNGYKYAGRQNKDGTETIEDIDVLMTRKIIVKGQIIVLKSISGFLVPEEFPSDAKAKVFL